jgi:hypothetical protein
VAAAAAVASVVAVVALAPMVLTSLVQVAVVVSRLSAQVLRSPTRNPELTQTLAATRARTSSSATGKRVMETSPQVQMAVMVQ